MADLKAESWLINGRVGFDNDAAKLRLQFGREFRTWEINL